MSLIESVFVLPDKGDTAKPRGFIPSPVGRGNESEVSLYRAFDKTKDQSYFLSRLSQHQLAHAIFPLGELTKVQVRQIAHDI